MWKYYITKSDMGYHIFRQKEENGVKKIQRLQMNCYTLYRQFAKTFYHLDEVLGAYIVARIKGEEIGLKFRTGKKFEADLNLVEKKSWSEL